MAHVRQQIRDNVVTTLTGLSTSGSNVFRSRVYPMETAKLPGLAIYTEGEETAYETVKSPRTQIRTLTITVDCFVTSVSNFDSSIDTMCSEIEEALATDLTRGGLAKDTKLVSFESDFSGEGEQPIAIGKLSVEITYSTLENSVETAR